MSVDITCHLPTDRIGESPSNPRKRFDGLAELAESIRTYGVLQPILVRPRPVPNGEAYECVFGHRRLRAAKAAGLATIPATVRELDDRQVLEAQLVENLGRQDLHPLEEGAAYHDLHEKLGYTVDEIGAKVGKSRGTVYARMKLCALTARAREALLDGRIDASTGLLIARIPNEKLQGEALAKLTTKNYQGDAPSYRQAVEIIQDEFMLRLADAPFSPKDAELCPDVGACTACPKRTGAQPELFPDVARADVCTDTVCYGAKRDAAWTLRIAKAKEDGVKVLTAKEAKEVFPYGTGQPSYQSAYVDRDEKQHVQALGKDVTPKALAKANGVELEVTLARDPQGGIHELVSRKAFEALARKLGKAASAAPGSGDDVHGGDVHDDERQRAMERLKREQEVDNLVDEKAVGLVVAAIEKKPGDAAWAVLFDSIAEYGQNVDAVAKRRGFKREGDKTSRGFTASNAEEYLRAVFEKATVGGRLALLVELAVDGHPDEDLLKGCGIDRKDLVGDARIELKAKRQAEAAAKAKGGKKPASKKAPEPMDDDAQADDEGEGDEEDVA